MSELNEKLQSIKLEKDKLTPEILKKGNTILGVEGSNRPNVKLFKSLDDMNDDPDKQQGDKAIVYDKFMDGMKADSELINLYFPKEVVLDEPFDGQEFLMLRGDYESGIFINRLL